MQESFIFYDSFREVGKDMEEKSRLAFYEAIIDYALTGELDETNLPKEIKLLFKNNVFNLLRLVSCFILVIKLFSISNSVKLTAY